MNIIVTFKCGLELAQGHWKWYHSKAWVRFPIFTFHSKYGRIFSNFGDTQRQRMAWPWNLGWVVQGHWKWCRSIDHHMTFYWWAIVTIALSCTIFELFGVK